MPELYTITTDWTEQSWFSTGGTRAKKYLLAPEGKFFYFKRSQFKEATLTKPGKDFKYEFWNEIIAYEVGSLLGFRMLRYDIAIDGNIMGCISESMINSEKEELIEGVKYLQAFSPNFDPSNKGHRTWYTFELIESSLEQAKIVHFMDNVIELIVLDTIIGNGDRHQENWAIITQPYKIAEAVEELQKQSPTVDSLIKKIQLYFTDRKFAPIYDSGSSLGRELLTEKVSLFLCSEEDLKKYLKKGQSEIHWENKKITHFELIRNLLNSRYSETVKKIIDGLLQNYHGPKIEQIIFNVDEKVPESHAEYRIPEPRKRLIYKIITLRFEMLEELINERI